MFNYHHPNSFYMFYMSTKILRGSFYFLSVLCTLLLMTACVNDIDETLTEGTTPITFKAKISKVTTATTRATATGFEKGDCVGLYAVQSAGRIDESRYINNLKLMCGESNVLTPERTVFYPEENVKLDFTAYFPYRAEAIPGRNSSLKVAVSSDQSTERGRTESDFLVASVKGVSGSNKAVELTFRHQFTKLKMVLTTEDGESAEEMLKSQPNIIAAGFNAEAVYDLQTKQLHSVETPKDIIPYGDWQVKGNSLTGKEFILIPQQADGDSQQFIVEWKGRLYHCPMPDLDMKGATQCEINIVMQEPETFTLTGIVGSIEEWTTIEGKATENSTSMQSVYLNALTFGYSNIYRAYNAGKPVVEICKELLRSDALTSEAIVAYPVKADGKADLSEGVVLRLPDKQDSNLCGGRIRWNEEENTFVYESGTLPDVDKFYLNSAGEILTDKPEQPLLLTVLAHKLRDIRNGELTEYPMVKIGTQYWMRADLAATHYRDSMPIARRTALGTGAGFLKPDAYDALFYNGEAVLESNLAPEGWKIPAEKDWERLKLYVKNDASLLKAGTWRKTTTGDVAYPASNRSHFGAYPMGLWIQEFQYAQEWCGYWTLNPSASGDTIPAKTVFLSSSPGEILLGGSFVPNTEHYKGLSVRCLQE